MTTTVTLAAALDALARVDDGTATDADHDCAEQLDRLIDEAAWRILDAEHARDVARWRDWHAEVCDGDDCDHCESPEEG